MLKNCQRLKFSQKLQTFAQCGHTDYPFAVRDILKDMNGSNVFCKQAQLKLADHLRKMGEQGKDIEGMDVDLNQVRMTTYLPMSR